MTRLLNEYCLSICVIYFCVEFSCNIIALHSFPTRRSSDLAIGRWGNFINQEAHGGEVSRQFLENLMLPEFIIEGMYINGTYYHPTFLRSEEHTSELQSRGHIVCRLLLEKKNRISI